MLAEKLNLARRLIVKALESLAGDFRNWEAIFCRKLGVGCTIY